MLKRGWIALTCILVGTLPAYAANAAAPRVIPVWPHLSARLAQLAKKGDANPKPIRGVIHPPVRWPTLTEYLAPKSKANGCAIISCPGGGYGILCVRWEGTDVARWANSIGVSCFVLTYRLPNGKLPPSGVPWPLQDVRRAVQIVRAHAARWHINPHDIGVAGFSAGGSVASLAGVHWLPGNPSAKDPLNRFSTRPDFLILGYPVISMLPSIAHMGSHNNLLGRHPPLDVEQYFSSELNVTPLTPPSFIFYAADDRVVSPQNEISFYKALRLNGVAAELHVYKHGGHGLVAGTVTGVKKWSPACTRWLKREHFIPAR